jgi:hypothetical protein
MSEEGLSSTPGIAQLRHLFESCEKSFEQKNSYEQVAKQLEDSLRWYSIRQRRNLVSNLRKICKELGVSTVVTKKRDLLRIILGVSYWEYQVNEFAMTMGSLDSFRKQVTDRVETISELTVTDIDKLATYFFLKGK